MPFARLLHTFPYYRQQLPLEVHVIFIQRHPARRWLLRRTRLLSRAGLHADAGPNSRLLEQPTGASCSRCCLCGSWLRLAKHTLLLCSHHLLLLLGKHHLLLLHRLLLLCGSCAIVASIRWQRRVGVYDQPDRVPEEPPRMPQPEAAGRRPASSGCHNLQLHSCLHRTQSVRERERERVEC